MHSISREEVLNLARASNIYIKEADILNFIKELTEVLSYASGLEHIAQEHPEYQMPYSYNITREDIAKLFDSKILLEQAPNQEEHYFVVPAILKQD